MAALITRCPVCATMFKVVPDQLRVSQGWVRCGHCSEVFDAGLNLQDPMAVGPAQSAPHGGASAPASPVPTTGARSGGEQALPSDGADVSVDPASEPHSPPASELSSSQPAPDSAVEVAAESDSISSLLTDEAAGHEPDRMELDDASQALREDPLDQPFELRRQDLSQPADLLSVPALEDAFLSAPRPLEEPTFVRQARRQARWQHPAIRALLVLAVCSLLAALALQVALQERDRLAAGNPALRPWLAQLCAQAGCRIGPPRRIDAIAIDSSSFSTLRPDAYRLQLTLKNQGRDDVAVPWLELTLTDSDDQAVVRRVLAPAELGATRSALAPAAQWSASIALGLTDASLASRISGYRLLAFYP